ncbi:hypothetical protein SKAU_G00323810 [Synaphobranchus kaupii]|uniref:Uncharacterized protein n=1 Tax=Synaphobranchus kaupii TaxID=118154 RepID=A0A9Q1EPC8_SYNKA|nr:hypothetical protein SKAU_G00323810 [Synaphobranchus kaupii]
MTNTLFISSIFLVVLVTPGFCQTTTVCKEEDEDIRVDCNIPPKANQINSYEFSITVRNKETVINSNVTGITADQTFKNITRVESLDSLKGYRLRLSNYPITDNTTFICKASGKGANVFVEKGKMIPCSAISLFLQSCPWLWSLLLFLHVTQSWVPCAL